MTKQPDPSRSSIPRHGSVVPSSISGDDSQPSIVPKLKTVAPVVRREASKPTPEQDNAAKQQPDSSKQNLSSEVLRRERDQAATDPQTSKQAKPLKPKKRWKPAPDPLAGVLEQPKPIDMELARTGVKAVDAESESFTIRERIEKSRHPLSSFLISLTVHVAIFLALALIAFNIRQPKPHISVIAEIDSTPTQAQPAKVETIPLEIDIPNENESPLDMAFDETSRDSEIDAAEAVVVAPNMVTSDADPVPAETVTAPVEAGTLPTGGGLAGRTGDTRASLAGRMGGTRESEMAVELGLKWIVAHQRKNGSWHFFHDDGNCNGDCGNQGEQEAVTAATGMALMALLGAGYTQEVGKYQEEVQKGLDYLVNQGMRPSGSMASGQTQMYAHAIATIALSEALSMTNDSGLVGPVDLARKYIERAQHKKGGWRYIPGQTGDLSVTGWQIMALKSCELSGFKTGPVTYTLAEEFVGSMAAPSQGYGYLKPAELPTMTAVGVLSKMYLGADLHEGTQEQSTRMLAEVGPSKTDMYFNFYATQVLHHRHDEAWADWNQEQRDYLIQTQESSGTHRAGSWYFRDHHGKVGGRLYTTAMAVMILEVYYRYLPLYEEEAVKQAVKHAINKQPIDSKD